MAIHVEHHGSRLVVVQRRRGLQIAMWIVGALYLGNVVVVVVGLLRPNDREVTVRCDRASARCTIVSGNGKPREVDLATVTGARVERRDRNQRALDAALILRSTGTPYEVCGVPAGAPAEHLHAVVGELAAFFADPAAASLDVRCRDQRNLDPPLEGLLAGLVGGLLILLAMAIFLGNIRTEIDRDAGTVRVRGRVWRKIAVERPIADVASVDVTWRYVRSSRWYSVWIRFRDGSSALVFSPAHMAYDTMDKHVHTLREHLGVTTTP